ncbi:MAG: inositol monophosphatase [Lactobacillaceae bacterium]|jgi:myo-inositol-1(or 4)-monophosphatase|nr:inositol monophosphatase [Lactobacillaceae bacterium]
MSYISPTLKLLINAVKKASNSMNRDFSEIERLLSSVKNHSDFVNSAFERVEKNLYFELAKVKSEFPVSKELLKNSKTPYFVISSDGIDNFAHGMGLFTICVAMCDAENNVLISLVYNPAMDELYFAEKGNGAYKEGFRNHERLRVSSRKDIESAVVSTNFAYDKFSENLRVLGAVSLELAYLASGKFDAVVSRENNSANLAAGALLVKEAGGYVYELSQQDIRSENVAKIFDSGNILAVNNSLSKKIHELVNS